MNLGSMEVDEVDVPEGHRPIDEVAVDRLSKSMAEIGLKTPIHVWMPDRYTCDLIAGRHRLEAAKSLGWKKIDCFFVGHDDGDWLTKAVWPSDENLIRLELTAEQRDAETHRRTKRVEQAQEEQLKMVDNSGTQRSTIHKKAGMPKGAAAIVAEEIGTTKQAVNRAVARDKARQAGQPAKLVDPDAAFNTAVRVFSRHPNKLKYRLFEEVYEPWYALKAER